MQWKNTSVKMLIQSVKYLQIILKLCVGPIKTAINMYRGTYDAYIKEHIMALICLSYFDMSVLPILTQRVNNMQSKIPVEI